MDKVTIIIPVYNAQDYLTKCVESVLAQTYNNWELLLIDDGSPDKSGAICDRYAAKDSRIITFHRKNGGVSSARNEGLSKATGEWILFLDSDDWLDEKCLYYCLGIACGNKLDLLQFAFSKVYPDGRIIDYKKYQTRALNSDDYVRGGNYNLCACGSLFKSEIVKNNNIRFDESLKLAEDQLFIMRVISCSNSIMYIPRTLYYYYQNEESATHHQKSEDMLRTCNAMIASIRFSPLFKEHSDNLIIDFITSMIENGDVSADSVIRIYKEAKIKSYSLSRTKAKMFYNISKFSPRIAYWAVGFLRWPHCLYK